jgi:hypothetical protein
VKYTPSLPPPQIQKTEAVTSRGAPRGANWETNKLRQGLTAGAYVISEGKAYFEFRGVQVRGYPSFSIQDFQTLAAATNKQKLFNVRFRRPAVFPPNYTFESAMPSAPDLNFNV